MSKTSPTSPFSLPPAFTVAARPHVLTQICDGAPHTIDELARECSMDASAIHAELKALAEAGTAFERRDDVVRLPIGFVALDAAQLELRLALAGAPWAVNIAPIIDSTNSELLRAARAGRLPSGPVMLAAEIQRDGRGRFGRTWHAPLGTALTVSFARRFESELAQLSGISLVCGLAVCAAVRQHGVEAQLKWPNDVLVQGRKLAGILVEVHVIDPHTVIAVIGIGLNVAGDAQLQAHLAPGALPATSLASVLAQHGSPPPLPMNRNALLADLAIRLDQHLQEFMAGGFAPFAARWNKAHALRDRPVQLSEPGERGEAGEGGEASQSPTLGVARDVDAQGRLRVDTPTGPRHIVSGEVSMRSVVQ